MPPFNKAKHVSKCLESAILFEVTANKPGNVNLTVGFEGTRVEHFLASAVAASASLERAAAQGIAVAKGKLGVSEAGVGKLMEDCVADIAAWQTGGNTLLGTVMLFVPLAVAAGMTPLGNGEKFDLKLLRGTLKVVAESTTAQDAVRLYQAVNLASPSGLNKSSELDVNDPDSKERLLKENLSILDVFRIGAGYDDICFEWVNNYPLTFDLGYPYLTTQLKTNLLNTAVVNTFLKILSERPDTFIARKAGMDKAKMVSQEAKAIVELGGSETAAGKGRLVQFDCMLRASGNNYNPGTTADITAATLALCTLSGYRP
jgi:triphosphoribosyl-dephospho-CoA synthase